MEIEQNQVQSEDLEQLEQRHNQLLNVIGSRSQIKTNQFDEKEWQDDEDLNQEIYDTKQHRKVYSQAYKEKFLILCRKYGIAKVTSAVNLNRTLVYKWIKDGTQKGKHTGRKIISEQHDKICDEWISINRSRGYKVSVRRFLVYAKRVAEQLRINLLCTTGWLQKFFKRKRYSIRAITGKGRFNILAKEQSQYIRRFIKQFNEFLDSQNISFDHIMNFDETSLAFDSTGNRTISFVGEDHVNVNTNNQEKQCYTLGLLSNMTGTYLRSTLIWPSEGKRSIITASEQKNNLIVLYKGHFIAKESDTNNKHKKKLTSWYSVPIMKETIKKLLIPHAQTLKPGQKGIVIMDNAPAHLDNIEIPELIQKAGYHLLLLPPNTTAQLQPNDLGINRLIKKNYRDFWENYYCNIDSPATKMSNDQFYCGVQQCLEQISPQVVKSAWSLYYDSILEFKQQELNRQKEMESLVPMNPEISESEYESLQLNGVFNEKLSKVSDFYEIIEINDQSESEISNDSVIEEILRTDPDSQNSQVSQMTEE